MIDGVLTIGVPVRDQDGELLRWPGVPPMFELQNEDGNGLEIVEAA